MHSSSEVPPRPDPGRGGIASSRTFSRGVDLLPVTEAPFCFLVGVVTCVVESVMVFVVGCCWEWCSLVVGSLAVDV